MSFVTSFGATAGQSFETRILIRYISMTEVSDSSDSKCNQRAYYELRVIHKLRTLTIGTFFYQPTYPVRTSRL